MEIRKAGAQDLELLIRIRLDYIREEWADLSRTQEERICGQLREYLPRRIRSGELIAMLAEENGVTASAAYLVVTQKPANPDMITGKTGTLINVLTYPPYRRRGIATAVIRALIEESKKDGISVLDLSATPAGRPLYEKLGFSPSRYTSMRLNLGERPPERRQSRKINEEKSGDPR